MAQAAFGFSVDLGLVSHLDVVVDTLDAAASGTADLAQFAPAASRLAEVTNAVRLLTQAGDAGLTPEEAAAFVIDTAGLSYLAAKMPNVIFLARTLGLLTENVPVGTLLSDVWDSLTSDLETEEDARRASIYLGAARHRGRVDAAARPDVLPPHHRSRDAAGAAGLGGGPDEPHSRGGRHFSALRHLPRACERTSVARRRRNRRGAGGRVHRHRRARAESPRWSRSVAELRSRCRCRSAPGERLAPRGGEPDSRPDRPLHRRRPR